MIVGRNFQLAVGLCCKVYKEDCYLKYKMIQLKMIYK